MIFGYPVSEQQLSILNLFGFNGQISLGILRLLSLILLIVAIKIWKEILSDLKVKNIGWYSVVTLVISPLMLVLVLVYPLICLKILIFTLFLYKGLDNKFYLVVLGLILILFNVNILGNNPAIFNKIDLQDAQLEVTKRISSEDSVRNSIYLPLTVRRATYNKIFISYKQIVGEILPFFDFESIFFAEINPLEQKSIVIFYWPEILLFVLGLYFLVNLNNKKLNNSLLIMIGLAWIDFVFSEGAVFKRLVLVTIPISVIISLGLYNLYLGAKKISLVMIIFILFGWINSIYDLSVRGDYWLDNRPLAFEFWYKEIGKLDLNKFDKIQISSLVGDAKPYCYFYLGKVCDNKKFEFNSFNLSKEKEKGVLYAGFAGEFVGDKFKNDIDSNWDKNPIVNIIAKKTLRDTIAYKYGNDIGVGIVK